MLWLGLLALFACLVFADTTIGVPRLSFIGYLILGIPLTGVGGVIGYYMVLLCPPEVRFSLIAVGYNVGQALFGGTAPLVSAAILEAFDWFEGPGLYFALLALVSSVSVVLSQPKQEKATGFAELTEKPTTDAVDVELVLTTERSTLE